MTQTTSVYDKGREICLELSLSWIPELCFAIYFLTQISSQEVLISITVNHCTVLGTGENKCGNSVSQAFSQGGMGGWGGGGMRLVLNWRVF